MTPVPLGSLPVLARIERDLRTARLHHGSRVEFYIAISWDVAQALRQEMKATYPADLGEKVSVSSPIWGMRVVGCDVFVGMNLPVDTVRLMRDAIPPNVSAPGQVQMGRVTYEITLNSGKP